MKRSR